MEVRAPAQYLTICCVSHQCCSREQRRDGETRIYGTDRPYHTTRSHIAIVRTTTDGIRAIYAGGSNEFNPTHLMSVEPSATLSATLCVCYMFGTSVFGTSGLYPICGGASSTLLFTRCRIAGALGALDLQIDLPSNSLLPAHAVTNTIVHRQWPWVTKWMVTSLLDVDMDWVTVCV